MSAWKHAKTGEHYEIAGFAVEEKTCVPVVVYMKIGDSAFWTRPCVEFFDGRFRQVPRPKRKPGDAEKPNFGPGHVAVDVDATAGLEDRVARRETHVMKPGNHPTSIER